MIRLALKMTLARKGRLLLTALAVILGTSFLSGTFIFRDTINKTFDELFSDVFRDVDAYVRSTNFIETNFGGEFLSASSAAFCSASLAQMIGSSPKRLRYSSRNAGSSTTFAQPAAKAA